MKDNMYTLFANFLINLFIFVLLGFTYTYVLKLEKLGCECAKHPNVDFIKKFSIFALVFIVILMLVPPVLLSEYNGFVGSVYTLLAFIFWIVFAVYLFIVMNYTRYLISEKCKCSEDMRRELILIGTSIELIVLLLAVLNIILLPIIASSINVIFNNASDVKSKFKNNLKNPISAVKNIPSQLKNTGQLIKSISRNTKEGFRKLSKKR